MNPRVVNNIFISNLNINLNLNINISIPPSPRSTRNNNQSIMDSFNSELGNFLKQTDPNIAAKPLFDEYPEDAYGDGI